jgi:hypothetical protein
MRVNAPNHGRVPQSFSLFEHVEWHHLLPKMDGYCAHPPI